MSLHLSLDISSICKSVLSLYDRADNVSLVATRSSNLNSCALDIPTDLLHDQNEIAPSIADWARTVSACDRISLTFGLSSVYKFGLFSVSAIFDSGLWQWTVDADKRCPIYRYISCLANPDILRSTQVAAGRSASDVTQTEITDIQVLLRNSFAQHASRMALASEFGNFTFAELDLLTRQTVAGLSHFGVTKYDCVGTMLDSGEKNVALLLACLRIGAIYCPIDASKTKSQRRMLLNCIKAKVFIIDSSQIEKECSNSTYVDWDTLQSTPFTDVQELASFTSTTPAYVIFTSGTTGSPKAILQSRRTLSNLAQWMTQHSKIDTTDRILQYAAPTFDIYLQEVLSSLVSGGTLYVISEGIKRDVQKLHAYLDENRIRTAFFPVAVLNNFFSARRTTLPASLEHLVVAGEQLIHAAPVQKGLHLHNHYGPSETHVVTTITYWPRRTPGRAAVGRPIINNKIEIVGRDGQVLPKGLVGEIVIKGENLFLGYIIDGVLQPRVDSDSYHTGDLGWIDFSDNLHFFSRIDRGIKVDGKFVNIASVEDYISKLPGVLAVTLIPEPSSAMDDGGLVPNAYYAFISLAGDSSALSDIKRSLEASYPLYMRPRRIIVTTSFPQKQNGKIDESALLALCPQRHPHYAAYTPPRSEIEHFLCIEIGKKVNLENVSISDNFFDIGLRSIDIVCLAHDFSIQFGTPVSAIKFFEFPIIQDFSEEIMPNKRGKAHVTAALLQQGSSATSKTIAITGIACKLPGCNSVDQYWSALLTKKICYAAAPCGDAGQSMCVGRLHDTYHSSDSVDDIKIPNPIPHSYPLTTLSMVVREALIHSGTSIESDERIGLIVCASESCTPIGQEHDYMTYFESLSTDNREFYATRIAHQLGLKGPATMVANACSSGGSAIRYAQSLLTESDCDCIVVAGISINPFSVFSTTKDGIISRRGVVSPYDDDADGTILTEGAVALVLREQNNAVSRRDHVYAEVTGIGLNNDGSVKAGYFAPSIAGQTYCMSHALSQAGISAFDLDYFEGHGTGTPLGDPIEMQAFGALFPLASSNMNLQSLFVGSCKGNIGHTNRISSLASIVKMALALDKRIAPPLASFTTRNQLIVDPPGIRYSFNEHPVALTGKPKYHALVNSLGFGGTNCTIILASVNNGSATGTTLSPLVFTLSATSREKLIAKAAYFLSILGDEKVDLFHLCFTLNEKPCANDTFRLAIPFTTRAELVSILRSRLKKCFDI